MTTIKRLLKSSWPIRALVAIIIAIPVMFFIEYIDKSGVGAALVGAAIIVFVFTTFGGTEKE